MSLSGPIEQVEEPDAFCIVLRMTGNSRLEGSWMLVKATPATLLYNNGDRVLIVATGSLEWDGDRAAEVYVPEEKLARWRERHPL